MTALGLERHLSAPAVHVVASFGREQVKGAVTDPHGSLEMKASMRLHLVPFFQARRCLTTALHVPVTRVPVPGHCPMMVCHALGTLDGLLIRELDLHRLVWSVRLSPPAHQGALVVL